MVLVAWIFWNKMVMSRAYSIFSSPANFLWDALHILVACELVPWERKLAFIFCAADSTRYCFDFQVHLLFAAHLIHLEGQTFPLW
jgi:hypothetical protein